MRIREVLLATNAKPWQRRLILVLAVLICMAYTIWVTDYNQLGGMLEFDPSDWLTYLIGLSVAAMIAPVGAWILAGLPPLIRSYKWDWIIIVVIYLGFMSLIVIPSGPEITGRKILDRLDRLVTFDPDIPVFAFVFVMAGVVGLKAIKWIIVGSPKPKANREP